MTPVQQWMNNNLTRSSDYQVLINRMRSGEHIECAIHSDAGIELAHVFYKKTGWGELFQISIEDSDFSAMHALEREFIDCCNILNLEFAEEDFLKRTRKMLEIARNAANFKAVMVPLTSVEDVEALLARINKEMV